MQVLFIGPAGSGKSLLTATFSHWLTKHIGVKVGCVNLDPGCTYLPYNPDLDVREMFTVTGIMEREKLGPNGAMIKAMEMMEERVEELEASIAEVKADILLVDTPGQMEVFVFRAAGPRVAEVFKRSGRPVAVYVLDPSLAVNATGLAVAASLMVATQLRLRMPTVTVLNKADQVRGRRVDRLLTDLNGLENAIVGERLGAMTDLALNLVSALRTLARTSGIVKVSAKTGYGMERLYDLCHEAFCECGET